MTIKKLVTFSLPSALFLAQLSTTASAAGFALIEHSASGMGNGFAGAGAIGEDASTLFFNPAAMTAIKSSQFVFAGHLITTRADYKDSGSSINPAFTGGTAIPGSLSGGNDDGGVVSFVPNFYYVQPVNDEVTLGIGINAPFGLETDYADDWVGRYHALNSSIQTININPSIAYKLNEKLSIGGGINLQYVHAKLSQAIDSAAVCLGATDPATCAGLGLGPGAVASGTVDSKAELEADTWSAGANIGLTYQMSDATRLGVSYRSAIKHDTDGTAKFTVTPGLAPVLAGVNAQLAQVNSALLVDSGITASVELPAIFSLSLSHQLNNQLLLLADITHTGWSSFKELRIKYNSGQQDSVTPENWDDVLRYSIGANYAATKNLTVRTGLAFDEEAIPDAEHRTPRIPGNDRTWLAFGLGYDIHDDLHFDVGYAHLFVDDTPIDHTDDNGYTLKGSYSADVNILSAQLTWNF
ncbi:MAG: OmpP1/FadL family transporter [Thiotrichales bacterium]